MASPKDRAIAARVLRDANHAPDDIADLLGVSLSQVYRYLNGEVDPRPEPEHTASAALEVLLSKQELDDEGMFLADVARQLAAIVDQARMSKIGQEKAAAAQNAKELRAVVAAIMDVSQDDKEWLVGMFTEVGDSED